MPVSKQTKWSIMVIAMVTLVAVYVLQRFSYAHALNVILPESMQIVNPHHVFMVNKTIRLLLNDTACMLLIMVWFPGRAYRTVAAYVFAAELLVILPVYLLVKLHFEGDSEISSPLLSHIHRLIVNPLLMFLLMIAFLYQRVTNPNQTKQ